MAQLGDSSSRDEDGRSAALAQGIAAYLARHPRARDTADGIRMWWLDDPGATSAGEVERTLDRLVGQGIMARTMLADGQTVYGAAGTNGSDGGWHA